ncbi:hypothetical protein HELRODRAFT_146064, partial [Helobdella robusta]|uniref:Cadherin domain-containing protein n=1 Tax=Helobdella robusta TaxID=6412 RepID=T1EJP9_HELRO
VIVMVTDVNDNAPQPEMRKYDTEIDENNEPEVAIFKMAAVDLDDGDNGRIGYSILKEKVVAASSSSSHFSIDETTGEIKALISFDYERARAYVITVVISDHGQPPLSSTALVRIHVKDLNDNRPTFNKTVFYMSVCE